MFGGFTCTKNALKALNILYIVVAIILICVATYGRVTVQITDFSIIEGIFSCGVFLLILSIFGLIGTINHHQVILFFYMTILFILFIVQFSIAFACLAFDSNQQMNLAEREWRNASEKSHQQIQHLFDCCGFHEGDPQNRFNCPNVQCCQMSDCSRCQPCSHRIQLAIANVLSISGWTGMFFSFTEFIGVWLTIRFRNQKNPRADPNVFL
ncbi:Tetraspanin-31 [Sarcoptes scabiei]|uniref:Tetraspanin-31 n=1 Tax=Sarcoptes scabiei TaxID=52283 RepID=A0A131ZZW5_SARSC|nr:Tetraspanin-31 [Sarcoptes scabiei]KPM03650.1 tetraspanin-like protein 2 [Sarcoptes scabiei]UXI18405.1 hypothetical protein NH340_JMT04348 [Sarcoptes scabiei]